MKEFLMYRGVRGLENWTIFMDVICVLSLICERSRNDRQVLKNEITEPKERNAIIAFITQGQIKGAKKLKLFPKKCIWKNFEARNCPEH